MKKLQKWIKEKKKKKGFTLVELLAVMVVLALIMVLVAPNVLNSMNASKKNALVIYGKKMISTAKENVETAKLSGDATSTMVYSIKDTTSAKKAVGSLFALATDQTQYTGCIKVTSATSASPVYTIYLVDKSNGIQINGKVLSDLNKTTGVVTSFAAYTEDVNGSPIKFTGASDKLSNPQCAQ